MYHIDISVEAGVHIGFHGAGEAADLDSRPSFLIAVTVSFSAQTTQESCFDHVDADIESWRRSQVSVQR